MPPPPGQLPIGVDTPLAAVYAMRAWYTSVLDQTRQVRGDVARRVTQAEEEVASLNGQLTHSDASIKALEGVLDTIDDWIRKLNATEGIFANNGGEPPEPSGGPGRVRNSARSRRGSEVVIEIEGESQTDD